jgi:AraC family transcriptional activator of tynA and feaB
MPRSPGDAQPGSIAWLDVSAASSPSWPVRLRLGPLGLQVAPLDLSREAFYLKGARLRGTRCTWGVASLNGAVLRRGPRSEGESPQALHVLIRGDSSRSVFDPAATLTRGVLKVLDPGAEVEEQFHTNAHLCTLNVAPATLGVEPAGIAEMIGRSYPLTDFQTQLVRSMAQVLRADGGSLNTVPSMVGVDRFLGSFTGLLLRTAVAGWCETDPTQTLRARTEAIIYERATDPLLTPSVLAAELGVSLRQLYRCFTEEESPAALIRRRRLERAAELLSSRRTLGRLEMIAHECGFASAEYFSRSFRREFGLSPRAYRSRHHAVRLGGG